MAQTWIQSLFYLSRNSNLDLFCYPSPSPTVKAQILPPPPPTQKRTRLWLAEIHLLVSWNITPPIISQMNYGVGARGIKWKGRRGGGRINMKDSRFSLEPGRARLRNVSILKQKIFWNTPQKVSSTKCFGAVRQNNFDGKSWYLPLSYPSHFSIPETFSDTEGFLYESFRYCEAINFRRKIGIYPSYA